jgi:hypothetical protein
VRSVLPDRFWSVDVTPVAASTSEE